RNYLLAACTRPTMITSSSTLAPVPEPTATEPIGSTEDSPPSLLSTPVTVREVALQVLENGLQVVPPKQDGSKRPDTREWKSLQNRRLTRNEVERQYANDRTGVGAITGAISGNVILFEFDERLTYDGFKETAGAAGLGPLVQKIEDGYCEDTPSGGVHWLIRVEQVNGNTKL